MEEPKCRWCGHPAYAHTYEATPDLSVPCRSCPGGRCPPSDREAQ